MNSDPTSLDRLHDIVTPPPVPWWPPAPAWYWVLAFLALLAAVLAVKGFLRWQHNRYRREALKLWREDSALLGDVRTRAQALVRLSELLKRTALSAFPRDEVASLTGPAWFGFLDRTAPNSNFNSGDGRLLQEAAYDSRVAATVDDAQVRRIADSVRSWIKYHTTR